MPARRRQAVPCRCRRHHATNVTKTANGLYGYRETDALGGHDPYSCLQGRLRNCVAATWQQSFFDEAGHVRVATARAGNVIGGGDWSEDRIIPDIVRASRQCQSLDIRSPYATRPWQHVLEPLSGYMMLAESLFDNSADKRVASAFNFGPNVESERTVSDLLRECMKHCPLTWKDVSDPGHVHEAERLALNIDKALNLLKWRPVWNFETAIKHTIDWYEAERSGSNQAIRRRTAEDIAAFETLNRKA